MDPYSSVGPNYENMRYPPTFPPPYQNFPIHNAPFPSIHHPPPPFVPPSVPPHTYFQSVFPSQLPTSQSSSDSVESEILHYETVDKQWVSDWLARHNIQVTSKKPTLHCIQLKDVHSLLLKTSSAVKDLQVSHKELSSVCASADETHWNFLLAKINEKKTELSLLLNKIRSLDLSAIKAKLKKRVKKRSWLKRRRCKERELKKAEQRRQNMLHQRADAWLAEMKLSVEREHREEELRREADAVLGEVTHKQAEAKRQIALLDALIKLREVRAQRNVMQASHPDVGVDHSANKFATVIERLRKLWRTQLKEYAAEESGLRAMLHASAAQKTDARCKRVKSDIELWHKAIFGESLTNAPVKQDINQLLTIRAEWDKYVVRSSANAPMASTIPVGWVLPQEPSSDLWRSYCVPYDKSD